MKFPVDFEVRMKRTLGEGTYEAFKQSFQREAATGIKINTHKISVEAFVKRFPYKLKPIPWTVDGFYYDAQDPVTKHPYFHAGLFYVQEPSAMAPVNILRPTQGDACLDLCAAPGGKSMQMANFISDDGILVSNDISDHRLKAVIRNIEKFGLRNVVVLNESPEKLARTLGPMFTSILVDAPCSGEGMFKKDSKAVASWEKYGPEACSSIQEGIVDQLEHLAGRGCDIVYSTCTFSEIENEMQIQQFLWKHSDFAPQAIACPAIDVENHLAHIWPHRHEGEGHFIAKLKRHSGKEPLKQPKYASNLPPKEVAEFISKHIKGNRFEGHYDIIKEKVYLKPEQQLPLKGLKVAREGLLVGEITKGRFTPSQALAMYVRAEEFHPRIRFDMASVDIEKYLKGETLYVETESSGLHLVCVDDFPVGFAKVQNGMLKNMYPASWRMQ